MQDCDNCGVSVFVKPLHRVNPKGEIGIAWCEDCLKDKEPELARNIEEDETPLEKTLKGWFY